MSEAVKDIIKTSNKATIFHSLGISVDKIDPDETICSLIIDQRHHQHLGLVHGGVYVLLAESAASIAGACTIDHSLQSVVALEINANHLRSKKAGKLSAKSKRLHDGQKTIVYEVRVVDENDQLVSISRSTLMKLMHKPM